MSPPAATIAPVFEVAAKAVLGKYGRRGGFCVEELVDEGWLHLRLYPLRDNAGGAAYGALYRHLTRYLLENRHGRSSYWIRHHPETRVRIGNVAGTDAEPWERPDRDGALEEAMNWCLRQLSEQDRWFIAQHLYYGRLLLDMAAEIGISEHSCARKYRRALRRFRTLWEESDHD